MTRCLAVVGWGANIICIVWTLFVCTIFALPTILPVTKDNMNYASVITVGVIFLSLVWYIIQARHHYTGPISDISQSAHGSKAHSIELKGADSKEDKLAAE